MKKFFWYWLPPILWMSLIFYLSSSSKPPLIKDPIINFFLFKTIHMIEFGTLFILLTRAFFNTTKINLKKIMLISFIWAVFYGASDEFHQTFISGRNGNPIDVFIDSLGIYFVYWYVNRKINFFKKYLSL